MDESVKKRLLQGLGLGLIFASPMWIAFYQTPSYFTFAVSALLGILLLLLASKMPPTR